MSNPLENCVKTTKDRINLANTIASKYSGEQYLAAKNDLLEELQLQDITISRTHTDFARGKTSTTAIWIDCGHPVSNSLFHLEETMSTKNTSLRCYKISFSENDDAAAWWAKASK